MYRLFHTVSADIGPVKSHNDQKPLIAYIAKGAALCGQGEHKGAANVFDVVLRDCDDDTKNFVERIRVSYTAWRRFNG